MAVRDRLRNSVVLDGSNIVHGGARGGDVDGNRLIEAIAVYRDHGYIVYPRMKGGTLRYMKRKRMKGYGALKRATKGDDETRLITYEKDDDLAIIELAVKKNAWIVTNDSFDGYYTSNGDWVDKERQKYSSKYDWKDIDDRIWGVSFNKWGEKYHPDETWHVEGPHFFHKGLNQAPTSLLEDKYSDVRTVLREIEYKLNEIDKTCGEIKDSVEIRSDLKAEINHIHPHLRKMNSLLPKPKSPKRAALKKKTVKELRDECWRQGLKVSGRKDELIKRLLSNSQ